MSWADAVRIRRAPVRIRLELPTIDLIEQASWAREIERFHNDCGCSAAAVAVLATVVSAAGYVLAVGFVPSFTSVALGALLAGITALASGKLFARWWSRLRLRRQVAALTAKFR